MPLKHLTDDHLEQLDGVRFVMTADGSTPVPCIVTHEALRDLAGEVGFAGSDKETFTAHRGLIERVASEVFDLEDVRDSKGRVLVTSTALTQAYRNRD
jgi:hypothetical protein